MSHYVDECQAGGIPFMYDPSQQVARLDGDALRHGIERCTYLICNEYEFEIIMQKTGLSREAIIGKVPVVIVTLGENGTAVYTESRQITVPIFPAEQIADPTGVGDAFRAGLLRGMSAGWGWELSGKVGALCATYVLEHVGTQTHAFTPAEFVARFRTRFDDDGALDALLAG
jgi:adenosine kinase